MNALEHSNAGLTSGQSAKPKTPKREVFAWECNVRGEQWQTTLNHHTAGKARYQYLLRVRVAWPDVTFADITVRKIGPAFTSEAFKQTARYRGLPDLCCGARVAVGTARGAIVAHNDCANFDVLFDEDSPKFAGLVLNVHPMELRLGASIDLEPASPFRER